MAPLPGSPVSNSTASESHSFPTSDDSDIADVDADSLTTPRAGPTDPEQRTAATLSQPAVPPFSSSPGSPKSAGGAKSAAKREEDRLQADRAERQKSVSFATSASRRKGERQGSYSMTGRRQQSSPAVSPHRVMDVEVDGDGAAESSSADENTAIFKQGQPSYGAADAGADEDEEHDERGNAHEGTNEGPGTVRKKKTVPVKRNGSARANSRPQRETQGDAGNADDDEEVEHESWWRYIVENFGSVELENKGSVARDHLALERTFLAWLRTSLSFASIGVAVTQLFRLNTSLSRSNSSSTQSSSSLPSGGLFQQLTESEVPLSETHKLRQVGKPLGATFLGVSILILLFGFHRYFESQHYVIRGKFPASRGTIIVVSLVTTALIVAALVVVLAIAPSAFATK